MPRITLTHVFEPPDTLTLSAEEKAMILTAIEAVADSLEHLRDGNTAVENELQNLRVLKDKLSGDHTTWIIRTD